MQFSFAATVALLASVAAASYNGTYPTASTGGVASTTGTISPSITPFQGAGSLNTVGSALGLVVAGGVALAL